jgi:3-dehydroquinate synthetase
MKLNDGTASSLLPTSVVAAWYSIPSELRSALVSMELRMSKSSCQVFNTNVEIPMLSSTESSSTIEQLSHSGGSSTMSEEGEEEGEGGTKISDVTFVEVDPISGTQTILTPVERAPDNVFSFQKTQCQESVVVEKTRSAIVTTKRTIVTTTKGWRNVFSVPISYDVNIVSTGTILDPNNPQLLDVTGPCEEGYNRRFAVIDSEVYRLYGDRIHHYFRSNSIELHFTILSGGEADKRSGACDKLLDDLCAYKLRRREPFLAIGGGVVLDIAGMAACLYRRGVPFVRVPTTLLAIVDASVGVKNGVDYCCNRTNETYKNRVGSFYAPTACLLDPGFIMSQDQRNICNGFGEIVKLALVRSSDLFELLETHGAALVHSRFDETCDNVPVGVGARIIDLSIQIMLEELGPNLWEFQLERCVDYGHTFSKLLEMVPGVDIMHGEAVVR